MARAARRAEAAELRLHLGSVDTGAARVDGLWRDGDIGVWSKADLGAGAGDVSVAVSDKGLVDALLELVKQRLSERSFGEGLLGHERQRVAVANAHAAVNASLTPGIAPEELAEELRRALAALDRLTGRLDVEDVLDVVFGSFCLGK